jgi:hypothetical protein
MRREPFRTSLESAVEVEEPGRERVSEDLLCPLCMRPLLSRAPVIDIVFHKELDESTG